MAGSAYTHIMTSTTISAVMIGKVTDLGNNRSAIRKSPVDGPVAIDSFGPVGDEHSDPNHGGVEKAVLHYAFDHYESFGREFPKAVEHLKKPGAFGENLSSSGITEDNICIGDIYRIGGTLLQVAQPRQPCWKLGWLAQASRIPHRMQETGWTGWYYRVLREGTIEAGNEMILEERINEKWPVSRLAIGIYAAPLDRVFLEEVLKIEKLGSEWRRVAERRLETGVIEPWTGRLELKG